MDAIKEWISGICAISLMIAILRSLLPESAVGKTFNIAASLLIVIALISPLKKIDLDEFKLNVAKSDRLVEEKVQQVTEENAKMADRLIEKELCEYICKKTNMNSNDISIVCNNGEIERVVLHKRNTEAKRILTEECGVDINKISERGV